MKGRKGVSIDFYFFYHFLSSRHVGMYNAGVVCN